jgi:hypothetical protein
MGAAEQVLAMEREMHEDNKRFNAEREILLSLAPDLWNEAKDVFKAECAKLSVASHRFQFECEEPDSATFYVNRVINGKAVVALEFGFNATVPMIICKDRWSQRPASRIDFVLSGNRAFLANGRSGIVLPNLVSRLMMQVTR